MWIVVLVFAIALSGAIFTLIQPEREVVVEKKLLRIADVLGKDIRVRNGVGYTSITDKKLYNSKCLEIGFGSVISGYGDWGGGASHVTKAPLKVVIDKSFNVVHVKTDSFYNSPSSKEVERKARHIAKRFKVGDSLCGVLPAEVEDGVKKILALLPVKYNINWEAIRYPHMVNWELNKNGDRDPTETLPDATGIVNF